MPPEIQGRWKAALKEVVIVEEIRFRRAVKPAGSEGNPEKIAYHDGSKVGSGCCIYLRSKFPISQVHLENSVN